MDEDGFSSYMKGKKNSLGKINSYANRIRRFEKYLSENKVGKSIKDTCMHNRYKTEKCVGDSVTNYCRGTL